MKRKSILTAVLLVFLSAGVIARAQIPVAPPAPGVQLRASAELDQMLGPIALYPDPLIAQILPSATLPSEIVLADRYVNGGGDPNLIDQQFWDPAIKALARYPTVLKWMDDNLAWTTALGQAFLYQQQDVMDSIQRLRAQAQALGNLQTTPQQNVFADAGSIEILPANPQVIYVPVYQPDVVYYQRPFGSPFISFGLGFALGAWLNYDFDWHSHHLVVWGHNQPRPTDWWSRRPSERPRAELSHATVWQPRNPPAQARGLDRGYGSHPAQNPVAVIGSQPRSPGRSEAPAPPPGRSEPAVNPRTAEAPRPVEAPHTAVNPRPAEAPVTAVAPRPAEAPRTPVAPRPVEAPRTPVNPRPAETPHTPVAPRPVEAPHTTVAPRPVEAPHATVTPHPANAALIGVSSAHDAQQFSNRGQASRQDTVSRPAAAPPAPAAHPAAPPHVEAPKAQGGKH